MISRMQNIWLIICIILDNYVYLYYKYLKDIHQKECIVNWTIVFIIITNITSIKKDIINKSMVNDIILEIKLKTK